MKTVKNDYLKLFSIILVISLLIVNVLGIPAFGTNSGRPEAVDEIGNIEYYVTSKTGYNITNNATSVKPTIVSDGFDNSNAIKFGSSIGTSGIRLRWQYNDTDRMRFEKGVAYTIEFKVKLVSGAIDNMYAGLFYAWGNPHSYELDEYKINGTATTSEWTTVSVSTHAFDQKLNSTDANYYTNGRYFFINFVASSDDGCVVLVDDIKIYATNDTEKTEMFKGAYLITKSNPLTPYAGGSDFPGTFDKILDSELNAIEPVDEIGNIEYYVTSKTGYNITNNATSVKPTVVSEGVDNSNAIKFGSSIGTRGIRLRWQYNDTDRLRFEKGVAYTIEFKVKLVSGAIDNMYAGLFYAWGNPHSYELDEYKINGTATTSEWTTVSVSTSAFDQKLNSTDANYYTNGRYFFINFVASSDDGCVVLVDDIKIYATNDTEKTEMFKGAYLITKSNPLTPYAGGSDFPGTFDKILDSDIEDDDNQGGNDGDDNTDDIPVDIPAGTNPDYEVVDEIGNTVYSVVSTSGSNVTNHSTTIQPTLVGGGANDSNALKLGATAAYKECLIRWQYNDTDRMKFELNKPYTIEFKVKPIYGELSEMYAGIFYAWGSPHTYNREEYKINSTATKDEWTTVSISTYAFDQKLTPDDVNYYTNGRHFFLNFVSNNANGCIVLVDDIKIYATDDAEKTEMFKGDYLITKTNPLTPYAGGSDFPGTFDKILDSDIEDDGGNTGGDNEGGNDGDDPTEDIPVDIPAGSNPDYKVVDEIGNTVYSVVSTSGSNVTNNSTTIQPTLVGGGANDSNALKLGATAAYKECLIRWQYNDTDRMRFKLGTPYTIEFKVKPIYGELSDMYAGIFYAWGSPHSYNRVEYKIDATAQKGEWTTVSISTYAFDQKLTPEDENYYTNGRHFFLNFVSNNENGCIVLVDDIKIYATNDTEKTEMFKGDYLITNSNPKTLYFGGSDLPGTFDKHRSFTVSKVQEKVDKTKTYIPANIYDWSLKYDANKKLIQSVWVEDKTAFPSVYRYADEETRYKLRPRISNKGEGVNGTYSLVIGDENTPTTSEYTTAFSYMETNTLKPNTEYTFTAKVKRVGKVNSLSIGLCESLSSGTYTYALTLIDSELDDEYLVYTWKQTTTDKPKVQWNALAISYSSSTGAKIYIDDLNYWRSDTDSSESLFGNGDFETVDLGEDSKETVITETMPEGESARLNNVYTNKAMNGTVNKARIVSSNNVHEGAEGTAVLAFGLEDTDSDIIYAAYLYATQPGKTYKISFWVKIIGDVDFASVGMYDSFWRADYYNPGFSFNKYEHGKWTKIEYEWTDTGTRSTAETYRKFLVRFKGKAGSGMLIDDVKITYEPMGENAPNIFEFGSFSKLKKEYGKVEWDTKYIYKEEE